MGGDHDAGGFDSILDLFGIHHDPAPPDDHKQPPRAASDGPAGGPKDLDYAAHYVDDMLGGVFRLFTGGATGSHEAATLPEAPKTIAPPGKPEGPTPIKTFDHDGMGKLPKPPVVEAKPPPQQPAVKPVAPPKQNPAAEWEAAEQRRPARVNPNYHPEPQPSVTPGKIRVAKGEGRVTAGYGKEVRQGDRITQTGGGVDTTGTASVATRTVNKMDEKGQVMEGSSGSFGAGKNGVNAAMSSTKKGVTTSGAFEVGKEHASAKFSRGNEKKSMGAAMSVGNGTAAVSVSGKYGPVSGNIGGSVTDKVTRGKIGDEGIDATLKEFVGSGSYVEHDSGYGVSAGADVEYGPFGAGGSGHKESMTKRRHFQSGDGLEKLNPTQALMMPGVAAPDLVGKDGFGDIDIDKLNKGEGYSFEQAKGRGGEGHIKAGITIGLGKDSAEMSQTVLARDADGDIRVMVAQGDQSALTGSISAGSAVSFAAKESKANSAQVAFTAHGPEGIKAVKEFQQTGLLPGADRVAKLDDPKASEEYAAAKKEWEEAVKLADSVKGYGAVMFKSRIDSLREKMCEAASPLNEAFLKHKGGSLDDAKVPGIRYDEHTITKEKQKDVSLGAFGHDLLHSGREETEWDKQYRADGKSRLEQGAGDKDTYVFDKDETAEIVLDPKGYAKDGDAVAMVMGGKQGVTKRERDILAKVGPDAFDMPKETIEAWRDGSMNEAQLADIAVTMTEGQLAKIRDKLAVPNYAQTSMVKSGVGAYWERVANGARDDTRLNATMRGDSDAKRDVALHEELGQLYADAAAARARQVLSIADPNQNNAFLQQVGMGQMLSVVDHVKTPEDFLKLTPEEQKLVIATGAMTLEDTHQNPYEAMRLVLQVKDKNQRNNLMRQLFQTSERRTKGADSAVTFVQWVQNNGELQHLPKEELDQLMAGVSVRFEDPDTKQHTINHDYYETLSPGLGNTMIGKRLADPGKATFDENMGEHMRQRKEELRADRITDLLQAARGEKHNVEAVKQAMATAVKENPEFIEKMWETLDEDPARAAWANYMLEGTPYHRETKQK